MGRIYSEAEKMMQVSELQRKGRHGKASRLARKYGNERKDPELKRHFWSEAERSRRINYD